MEFERAKLSTAKPPPKAVSDAYWERSAFVISPAKLSIELL